MISENIIDVEVVCQMRLFISILLSFFLLNFYQLIEGRASYAAQERETEAGCVLGGFVKPEVRLTSEEQALYEEIIGFLKMSPYGAELVSAGNRMQFQFGGFLSSSNDAITIPSKRLIEISSGMPVKKAALALAYELVNVANSVRYTDVIHRGKQREISSEEYVSQMAYLEAEAAYGRSVVAKELGVYHLDPFHSLFESFDDRQTLDQKTQLFARNILVSGSVDYRGRPMSLKEYYARQYDQLA